MSEQDNTSGEALPVPAGPVLSSEALADDATYYAEERRLSEAGQHREAQALFDERQAVLNPVEAEPAQIDTRDVVEIETGIFNIMAGNSEELAREFMQTYGETTQSLNDALEDMDRAVARDVGRFRTTSEWLAHYQQADAERGAPWDEDHKEAAAFLARKYPTLRDAVNDPAIGNNPAIAAMIIDHERSLPDSERKGPVKMTQQQQQQPQPLDTAALKLSLHRAIGRQMEFMQTGDMVEAKAMQGEIDALSRAIAGDGAVVGHGGRNF